MLTTELIRKIRRIEIRTRKVVSEAVAGRYLSAFKGRGMEFESVRPYEVGDDVRSIDWNVSARAGSPHIKMFREERELTVLLAVDLSGSLNFGSNSQLKRELLAEVAATLAFSAVRNNDRVGLLAFTDRIELWVPPRKGRRHVLRIVRDLLALKPRGRGTDLATAIDEVNHVLSRRSVVFVLSDFLANGWAKPTAIAAARHDFIPVVVSDSREESLLDIGMIEVEDPESGERFVVDTGSRAVRQRYHAFAAAQRDEREATFRRVSAEPIRVQPGEDFVEPMVAYFRRREARRAR